MQKKLYSLIGLLTLAMLLSACAGNLAQNAQPPVRTLNVNGSGQVFVVPDIAYISVGVHTEDKSAAEAVAENNSKARQVAEVLKKMGVEEKDIKTTNLSIYPQQVYDTQGMPTGEITYVVDNTVYVTVRDLTKLGEILDAVVSAGANNISGVSFDLSDKVQALSDARKAAVDNARAQADELAKQAGVTLGAIQSINAYGGYPVAVYEGKYGVGGGEAVVEMPMPVSPGQLTLTVEVNITYEIK